MLHKEDAGSRLQQMLEEGRSFSGNERNCCFLNIGGKRFATASAVAGFDQLDDGRALALVDWDHDGDVDVWTSNRTAPQLRFLRNELPGTNAYVTFHLTGNGTTCNRDAIGARITITTDVDGIRPLIRTLRAGEGFLSQNSKWLNVGLGPASKIESVSVDWPDGSTESFEGVQVNTRCHLVQGSGKAVLKKNKRQLDLTASVQPASTSKGAVAIPLVTPLPLPNLLPFLTFDGQPRQLEIGDSTHTLLVLWASWCTPCQLELLELKREFKQLKDAGIRVVALAVDGLGGDDSDSVKAKKLAVSANLPFETGMSDARLPELFQEYHDLIIAAKRPLPVPSSFLIDQQGNLRAIYKGRVGVARILRDALQQPSSLHERWQQAAAIDGRMLDNPAIFESLRVQEANTLYALAGSFQSAGNFNEAIRAFEACLAAAPEFADARLRLGESLNAIRRSDEAISHFRRVIQLQPTNATAHAGLGRALAAMGDHAEAIASYRRAVAFSPDSSALYASLGAELTRQSKYAEAIQAFSQAIRIDPQNLRAQRGLAEARRRNQRQGSTRQDNR